jgi:hypothetical protein
MRNFDPLGEDYIKPEGARATAGAMFLFERRFWCMLSSVSDCSAAHRLLNG